MVADPARVGSKLAAVGNGFAARAWRRWRSSWAITALQDELFIFPLLESRQLAGRMRPRVPAAHGFWARLDLGGKGQGAEVVGTPWGALCQRRGSARCCAWPGGAGMVQGCFGDVGDGQTRLQNVQI